MIDSERIRKFFEHYQEEDGFWDAIHESGVIDYDWWYEDTDPSYFEDGYNFALSAESKPVCRYVTGANTYYWVGTEDEVIIRLQECWDDWQDLHPPETEEEKRVAAKRKKQIEIASKMQKLKKELKDLGS